MNEVSRLSIADERHASVKSSEGRGLTIAIGVDDIHSAFLYVTNLGLNPTSIKKHAWNAKVFHVFDHEGTRLKIWEAVV